MRSRWLVLGSALALLGGCGPGALGNAVRPGEKSVSEARGDEALVCGQAVGYGSPLVVDWPSERRGDLEVAMKQGVALVRHDCKGTRVVPACKARGTYGFMGVSLKKESIELKTADELSANLPLGAVSIGASLSASSSIEVDLRMVGVSATTRNRLGKVELEGDCGEATHFVQTATLGAFVVGTKTAGQVSADVKTARLGDVKGDSSSTKNRLTGDGEVDACEKWDPDSDRPPAACRAVLRLQLVPVAKDDTLLPDDKAGSFRGAECAEGFSFVGGKCTRQASAKGHLCDPTSEEDCERQCKLGNVGSCTALGRIYREGIGTAKKSIRKAVEPLQTACEASEPDARACLLLARSYQSAGRELNFDEAQVRRLARRASWLLQGACGEGNAESCWLVGDVFRSGSLLPKDLQTAHALLEQSCNGGYARACFDLAASLKEQAQAGKKARVNENDPLALDGPPPRPTEEEKARAEVEMKAVEERRSVLMKRSCNGGFGEACYHLATDGKGDVYKVDMREEKFNDEQRSYMRRACEAEFSPACRQYASMLAGNDDAQSKRYLNRWREIIDKRCDGGMAEACEAIGLRYTEGGSGLEIDPKIAASGYERRRKILDQRCQNEDAQACSRLTWDYEDGINGLPRDKEKAKEYSARYRKAAERTCTEGNTSGCLNLSSALQREPEFDGFAVQRYLELACRDPMSKGYECHVLGDMHLRSKRPPFGGDVVAIETWWGRGCQLGNAESCQSLGDLYASGKLTPKNEAKAFSYYDHACRVSRYSGWHCSKFEAMLREGRGAPKDDTRLFNHVKNRCETNPFDSTACLQLSDLHAKGIGTKASKKEADNVISSRVCFDGPSCDRAGYALLYSTLPQVKDVKRGASFFKKACDGSMPKPSRFACLDLGNLYMDKKGGMFDPKAAAEAFEQGCKVGLSQACERRDQLAGKKTADKPGSVSPDAFPANPYKK